MLENVGLLKLVYSSDDGSGVEIVSPALNGEGALAGGIAELKREGERLEVGIEKESIDGGLGEYDAVILQRGVFQLVQTSLYIAPDIFALEMGVLVLDGLNPPQRAAPHHRVLP